VKFVLNVHTGFVFPVSSIRLLSGIFFLVCWAKT